MKILAFETSCDESAIAIMDGHGHIVDEEIYTQKEHLDFGGVVPEIAARAHIKILPKMLDDILKRSATDISEIDYYAATIGPGLIGGLLVGSVFAKSLAYQHQKKFIAVNHLEGHALSARIEKKIAMPFLLLLVSGGHSQILIVEDVGTYHLLGQTMDDSAGEAFDKTARILGLAYPGGPMIEKCAMKGDPHKIDLPRPLTQHKNCHFSFSGLKTAIYHIVQKGHYTKEDIAASFQLAVSDTIVNRMQNAIDIFKKLYPKETTSTMCVAGGVASNMTIRHALDQLATQNHMVFHAPSQRYCTDNASMIAYVAYEKIKRQEFSALNVPAMPRFPLVKEKKDA